MPRNPFSPAHRVPLAYLSLSLWLLCTFIQSPGWQVGGLLTTLEDKHTPNTQQPEDVGYFLHNCTHSSFLTLWPSVPYYPTHNAFVSQLLVFIVLIPVTLKIFQFLWFVLRINFFSQRTPIFFATENSELLTPATHYIRGFPSNKLVFIIVSPGPQVSVQARSDIILGIFIRIGCMGMRFCPEPPSLLSTVWKKPALTPPGR